MRMRWMGMVTSGWVILAGLSGFAAEPAQPLNPEGVAFYERNIRPLLAAHCYKCHSHQSKSPRGGLLLDSSAGWTKGGDSGPALIPGDPDKSLLIRAVRGSDDQLQMPPKGKLSDKDIALLVQWVKMGAPSPRDLPASSKDPSSLLEAGRKHWAFQPLRRLSPPAVRQTQWCRTPIDRFILAKLEEQGLTPNPPAERRVLIRRVFFDLIGLPPTPEEIDAFVADPSPDAYERLIDRLLASPHYGERWARHWLDVARFAESHGYEQDYDRPYAYPYRDFVIRAFNADMPYDQFVRWQIAGDELAPNDPLAMAATGFLGAGPFPTQLTEAEFERARYDELDDMTTTTGVAFLGLSVGCARCHDHKFDPIPSRDYYRLAAAFTTTIRSDIDLTLEVGGKPTRVQVTSEGLPHQKHNADDRGYPHFYSATYFLHRGDPSQKRGVAAPGFLQVLMRTGKDETYWRVPRPQGWTRTRFRRSALAQWLTDVDNGAGHLAARVMVNRLWQHHFGRGLVATPNDFGTQGEHPTHPELLDWLAADLIDHGWRLKRLHKRILTSAVYMQNNQYDEARAARDRSNAYLWRRSPRRLEAEPIRDAMLAVSGLLDTRMYGPGSLDPAMRRRSIYFFIKRSQLIPLMLLFDWPEHLVSIGQRSQTVIAPQALALLNGPLTRQYAEGFAQRLSGLPLAKAVARGYVLAFGRAPTEAELQCSLQFLSRQSAAHRQAGRTDGDRLALVDFCQALFCMNEFIYVD
jgi:mono/diheme cytochrome c family protein